MIAVLAGTALRFLGLLRGLALFPGHLLGIFSLLLGGAAGFLTIFSDAAVFALGGGGQAAGDRYEDEQ
jgi:hypothetical protein